MPTSNGSFSLHIFTDSVIVQQGEAGYGHHRQYLDNILLHPEEKYQEIKL